MLEAIVKGSQAALPVDVFDFFAHILGPRTCSRPVLQEVILQWPSPRLTGANSSRFERVLGRPISGNAELHDCCKSFQISARGRPRGSCRRRSNSSGVMWASTQARSNSR